MRKHRKAAARHRWSRRSNEKTLKSILAKALVAAGLDPYAGIMHTPRQGRLSLVYDFSELYKPLVIHAVIQASRTMTLKQHKQSRRLTSRSLEHLTKYLHYRLQQLNRKTYKRTTIWTQADVRLVGMRRRVCHQQDTSYIYPFPSQTEEAMGKH